MGETTAIGWCDHTFNPWIGCTPVSSGCDFCYAEREAKRRNWAAWGAGEPRRRTSAENWKLPIRWDKKAAAEGNRKKVFCSSLADVFDSEVSNDWRVDLFDLINATPNLDWLLLTKRPNLITKLAPLRWEHTAPKNVWYGTTVESQETIWRIPELLKAPAVCHFLSLEPLLGLPDITEYLVCGTCGHFRSEHDEIDADGRRTRGDDWSEHHWEGVDWVIAGGESGGPADRRLVFGPVPERYPAFRPTPKARMWMQAIRDTCAIAGTPFFFKQWGGSTHAVAGDILDGRQHKEFPDVVTV
jgi:protein gp37